MKIYQVDAFTERPFLGNPAGVCILEENKDGTWMEKVAAEMNLSETAFLRKQEEDYDLRWFTPTQEVDLCGHGTLAAAHILFGRGDVAPNEKIKFQTRSGTLRAGRKGS